MKRRSIFILALAIIFLSSTTASAAVNYPLLKDEYIQDHPGQAIIPFPWEPSTSIRVLPINYEIPAAPGNTISMTACRDEFEPATFIITAQKDLSGVNIIVPNLYDVQGNSIPSSAIDVRLVKVWYQASNKSISYTTAGYYLTPELLLKDDSLVKVDYVTKTNYLKATINGVEQYIDISSPTAMVPQTAQVRDAPTLQPFSLKANENKQVWITVHVPNTTPAGNYSGTIMINVPSETPVAMTFTVTVLPFDLEPAPVDYALYYLGDLNPYAVGIDYSDKTAANMLIELQDMKDHGVLYPTLYMHSTVFLDQSLTLRDTIGFPKDRIYTLGSSVYTYIGNPTDTAGLATVATTVNNMRNRTSSHGYTSTYFYGIDELMGAAVTAERPAWQTVHESGGKMYVAGDTDLIDLVPDLLDVAVIGGPLNTTQAALWHSQGKQIYNYGNPQVGVENPEIYRKNYGVALWNAGYDGSMDFAYQQNYGDIWNDFDSQASHYRDHVFAYPTSNGVIDTIQWEGFREGADDTRYVASLIKKDGSEISAKSIVSTGLANNENMATIRKNVINRILLSYPAAPVANFTGTSLTGTAPLTVTFTDTSTNSPTSWNWSFGDGSLVNATVRNPVHTYISAGNYTVALNVKNAAGNSSTTRLNYITVIASPAVPVANFTGTSLTGTAPLTVTFTDTSTNSPTSWNWSFGDGSLVNATVRNPVHTYISAGNYTVALNVKNAAGSGSVIKTNYIRATSKPPTVTSISPTSGPAAGGTTVTIIGSGFTSASKVMFGTTPGTGLQVTNDKTIIVISPAGTGTVDVHVTTPGGPSVIETGNKFTYGSTIKKSSIKGKSKNISSIWHN
jgi:PKD repeat protein